ncbi:MAG: bacteriohemerythrin [Terracidiphilus sp.]
MPLLTWNDSLSVGVRAIDSQHSALLAILGELYDAMMKGRTKQVSGPLLHKFIDCTRDHFAAEEAMMAAAEYSGLAAHRREHERLTKQVEEFAARFDRGECTVNIELLRFLRTWLTNHIQQSDKAYGPCLVGHGIR